MVQVKVQKQKNKFQKIVVSGHADFCRKKSDIVCSAISAIVFGTLNALDKQTAESVNLLVNDNEVQFIVIKSNDINQIILKTMIYQLETIVESYKKNLKIEEI